MANQAMDLELKTMQQIWRLLSTLEKDSQVRVLDWVNDRHAADLDEDVPTSAPSSDSKK